MLTTQQKYFGAFYRKTPTFRGDEPLPRSDYEFVGLFRAADHDEMFALLNSEDNPLGTPEEQRYIREKMLHTSMSVGDVLKEKDGPFWLCLPFGWKAFDEFPQEAGS